MDGRRTDARARKPVIRKAAVGRGSDSSGSARLRIGTVPYMNAKPLVYGLAEAFPEARLVEKVPSRLTPLLARGKLDLALVPVMGYLQIQGVEIVPGICIGSRGPVESVILFHRVPMAELRRVRLDASSMTSSGLLRILLADRYHLAPQVVAAPPVSDLEGVEADGVLLIGDPAMTVRARGWSALDLGAEWQAMTGLPLVYAVWAARRGAATREVIARLKALKEEGLARIEEIARAEAPRLGFPVARCRRYLRERVCYDLGPAQIAGLKEYRRRAVVHGLADSKSRIAIARE